MNIYERIFNILIEGEGRSHDAPGHEERMKAHIKRIRSHPEFKEDRPEKPSGGTRASKKTQAANARARKKEAQKETDQFSRGTVSQQRGK